MSFASGTVADEGGVEKGSGGARRIREIVTHDFLYVDSLFPDVGPTRGRHSELEKWTETEAAGGSTAGPGRCTT